MSSLCNSVNECPKPHPQGAPQCGDGLVLRRVVRTALLPAGHTLNRISGVLCMRYDGGFS